MKLFSIEFEGYRRFASKETLHLDCRVVALLGPNESGKTSLLRLLERLNDETAFATSGPSQDLSRGKKFKANHVVVSAKFLLEKTDYPDLNAASSIARWLIVEKTVSGTMTSSLVPQTPDILQSRESCLAAIDGITNEKPENFSKPFASIRRHLLPESKSNPAILATFVDSMPEALSALEIDSDDIELLSSHLLVLSELEKNELELFSSLIKKIPQFVMFGENDRNLNSEYELAEFFGKKNGPLPPKALQNLADAAKVNLRDLYGAMHANDSGRVETILSAANDILKEKMIAWSQSKIEVRLVRNGTRIGIVAGKTGAFDSLSERSDGLRQFVALSAFLSRQVNAERDVILLLDEAEVHLHYDAQADLVQMFHKQKLAKKVIYSTHSFACLPEDLGSGIRFVQPVQENSTSTISNKFWVQGTSGLSPILFGMGAATMAFLPVRFCVLVEGVSDLILLPAMLREANDVDSIGFQVSPGLAEAGERKLALLNNEGARVLYLVDGDDGGDSLVSKIAGNGVPTDRIFQLSKFIGRKSVIEDLIDKDIYTEVINEELLRLGVNERIASVQIDDWLRPNSVNIWAASVGIADIRKVNVAYGLLERTYNAQRIVAERDCLKQLFAEINAKFAETSS